MLAVAILLPYAGLLYVKHWYKRQLQDIDQATVVLISKEDMKLSLINYSGEVLKEYGIACGKNYGNKCKVGDMKTPEGVFHISDIEQSDDWTHDFGDGHGEIEGAYGPWFLRLETPGHRGIGIHGTHDSTSIGKRVTEGCIRLRNQDIADLKQHVRPGTTVIITPSAKDVAATAKQNEAK